MLPQAHDHIIRETGRPLHVEAGEYRVCGGWNGVG